MNHMVFRHRLHKLLWEKGENKKETKLGWVLACSDLTEFKGKLKSAIHHNILLTQRQAVHRWPWNTFLIWAFYSPTVTLSLEAKHSSFQIFCHRSYKRLTVTYSPLPNPTRAGNPPCPRSPGHGTLIKEIIFTHPKIWPQSLENTQMWREHQLAWLFVLTAPQ